MCGVLPEDPEFASLITRFDEHPGVRSIIVVDVTRVSESCGYGVPFMHLEGHRDVLDLSNAKKGPDGLAAYRADKNALSVDGLPGL